MNADQWDDLLRDLCSKAGITDVQRVLQDGEFAVDGMDIGLVHDETGAPDHCSLYYNLGSFDMTPELMTSVLQNNLRANPAEGALCLSACASRLVYRANVQVAQLDDGAQLLERIHFHHAVACRLVVAARGE